MNYDFKQIIKRENTRAVKWDMRENLFGRDDVLPMWVADMDFLTVPQLKDAIIERAEHNLYGYTTYDQEIIDLVIQWVKDRHDFDVDPNLISFSSGVIPSLHALVQAFTKEKDKIVIQPPVYPPFFAVIKSHNREILENPLTYENGYYSMNLEQLEEHFKNGAKAFILCSPHNPVGRVWTKDELQKVAELCVKYNVYLFSDEIHNDVVFNNSKHYPIANLNESIKQLTFSLMAPSKTFNVAGLQASYIISPNPEAKKAFDAQLLKQGFSSLNTFGCVALEAVYKHGKTWLENLLKQLEDNRNMVIEQINKSGLPIHVVKSEGTYLVWLDFTQTGLDHEEIKRKLIHEAKLGLNDGLTFGTQGEKFMRMNIACPPSTIEEGLNRLITAFK
ncbi:MalY/PatB family protein [Bacillaceae bacterium W0354]